jgi:hypothetical protein
MCRTALCGGIQKDDAPDRTWLICHQCHDTTSINSILMHEIKHMCLQWRLAATPPMLSMCWNIISCYIITFYMSWYFLIKLYFKDGLIWFQLLTHNFFIRYLKIKYILFFLEKEIPGRHNGWQMLSSCSVSIYFDSTITGSVVLKWHREWFIIS